MWTITVNHHRQETNVSDFRTPDEISVGNHMLKDLYQQAFLALSALSSSILIPTGWKPCALPLSSVKHHVLGPWFI